MFEESIIIGGDFLPTEVNTELFIKGRIDTLFGDGIIDLFRKHAWSVVNLEGPLTEQTTPITKSGPLLKASRQTVKAMKHLGIKSCSLANNHIMDYGNSGLFDTIKLLKDNEIEVLGAGINRRLAQEPMVVHIANKKIGFYSCCDYEFSGAGTSSPGANLFDPLETTDNVQKIKQENRLDYLVVLYHGGKEYYRYPSPNLQKICRKLVEKGADLVLCQHSHCIGCKEDYMGGEICYGQGNFLLSKYDNEFVSTGLLVSIDLSEKKANFIPVVKTTKGVEIAAGDQKKKNNE